jgi:hypothetical protein
MFKSNRFKIKYNNHTNFLPGNKKNINNKPTQRFNMGAAIFLSHDIYSTVSCDSIFFSFYDFSNLPTLHVMWHMSGFLSAYTYYLPRIHISRKI